MNVTLKNNYTYSIYNVLHVLTTEYNKINILAKLNTSQGAIHESQ